MTFVPQRISQILCISSKDDITRAYRAFSLRQKFVGACLLVALIYGVNGMIRTVSAHFSEAVPARGGSFTEGIVGIPRFINPLLAVSDADRDLTSLIYSGLMRQTEENTLVPDLAASYEVSDDGLQYTFTLKKGLTWHDGSPFTADDVDFTIKKAQDTTIKSPRIAAWQRVTVEKVDDSTIVFRLKQPYAQFLENTTLGILPKHLWTNVRSEAFQFSERNNEPIGTGPYRIASFSTDSSGSPSSYTLKAFDDFALGAPYIQKIVFKFYPNEDSLVLAFRSGAIEAASSISPENASSLAGKKSRIERAILPRIFAVFFNQNQSKLLLQKPVRIALDAAIDRNDLVENVLKNFAAPADGPIPSGALGYTQRDTTDNTGIEYATSVLEKNKWVRNTTSGIFEHVDKAAIPAKTTRKNGKTVVTAAAVPAVTSELALTLTTVDKPELVNVAEYVADAWTRLGARVTLEKFELGDLNQNIIRPRKFEALFFGEVIGRDPDLYSFWDSGQRNDPGLNIAQYANITVDKLLSDARTATDPQIRAKLLTQAQDEIRKDIPAVFLYSPQFLYVVPERIRKSAPVSIITSSERFTSIYQWYIDTDNVWKIFIK